MDRLTRRLARFDADNLPCANRGCYFDKGGSAAPAAPAPIDPSVQVAAQARAMPSIYSPQGSSVYSGDPNVAGSFARTDTYSPTQQRQFDSKNAIAEALLGRAGSQFGQLPSAPFSYNSNTPNGTDTQSQQLVQRLRSMSDSGFNPNIKDLGTFNPNVKDLGTFNPNVKDLGTFNPNIDGSAVRNAYFAKQKALLDPVYSQEQTRLDQKLANQGLPIGSEAYDQANSEFARNKANAYDIASQNAIMGGAQEEQNQYGRALNTRQQQSGEQNADYSRAVGTRQQQVGEQNADYSRAVGTRQQQVGEQNADYSRAVGTRQQNVSDVGSALGASQTQFGNDYGRSYNANEADVGRQLSQRQQNYNELAALLGGSQLQPVAGGGGSPLDVSGAYTNAQAGRNSQYQGQLANYNAGVSSQNSMNNGLFSLGAAALPLMFSDARLKRDIVRQGTLIPGVGIYEYEYIWGGGRQIGVMAHEVLDVVPEAVVERPDGFLMVDYGVLLNGRTLH